MFTKKPSTAAAAAAAVVLATMPSALALIPDVEGFELTWGEDFIGEQNSLPNPSNWIIDQGTSYPGGPPQWGTGEIQTYTSSPENLRLNGDGALEIQAHQDEFGGWTSARIETQRSDFVAAPGGRMRIQASLNLPELEGDGALIGYWPAFWSLGSDYRGNFQNWPGIGEFDIMENVNGVNGVWGVLHCGTAPGGPCNESEGLGSEPFECPGSPCQGNFHTYTVEVDRTEPREALRWFVDGEQFFEIDSDRIPGDVWEQAVHEPHFVLLNLAMGGAFPDGHFGSPTPVDSTASGGIYQAEYVAVYNA